MILPASMQSRLPAGESCVASMDAASARIYRSASWRMPLPEKRPVPDRIRDDLFRIMRRARVAELVDAHDSKSCSARSGGSIPSTGTTKAFAIIRRHSKGPAN